MKRTIEEIKAVVYSNWNFSDSRYKYMIHTLSTVMSRLDKLEEAEPKATQETLNV